MFAVAAISLGLTLWRVTGRTLYWDDLLIPALYADYSEGTGLSHAFGIPSLSVLFASHDGHMMPASIALQIATNAWAPLQWWLPATFIVAGHALSLVLWARLLPHRALAFGFIALSPFLGVAMGWWSAAVNALAWQVACALVLLCVRRASQAHGASRLVSVIGALLVLLVGLLFTEKAMTIAAVTTALLALDADFLQPSTSATHFLRNEQPLPAESPSITKSFLGAAGRLAHHRLVLLPLWALTLAWAYFFSTRADFSFVDSTESTRSVIFDSIPTALLDGIVPGLWGGPWHFDRWTPANTFATAPAPWAWAAVALLVLVVAWWVFSSGRHRLYVLLALSCCAVYLGLIFVFLSQGRSGAGTTDLITRTLHYYADWFTAVVLILATVVPHAGESRGSSGKGGVPKKWLALPLLALSAAVTTHGYVTAWKGDPTGAWLRTIREELPRANAPLLPQPVPATVLQNMGGHSTLGDVAKAMRNWPGQALSTPEPVFITDDGHLLPADVYATSMSEQGDAPGCGVRIDGSKNQGTAMVKLAKPMQFGEWTWELHTVSDREMELTVFTPNGLETHADSEARATTVTVPKGAATQYVRVSGGGEFLEVHARPTDGGSDGQVCIGAGRFGPLLPK